MSDQTTRGTWTLAKTATVTALTVVAFLGTLLIRIPIPATTGYFNVGDIFVVLAGLWLGPVAGLIVGGIGPAAADAVGYPQFIVATAVTKGLEGVLVGLVGHGAKRPVGVRLLAAGLGGATVVGGYFIFEAFIYPALGATIPFFNITTIQQAVTELFPNAIQAVVAAAVGFGLWRAAAGLEPRQVPDDSMLGG